MHIKPKIILNVQMTISKNKKINLNFMNLTKLKSATLPNQENYYYYLFSQTILNKK